MCNTIIYSEFENYDYGEEINYNGDFLNYVDDSYNGCNHDHYDHYHQ